MNSEDVQLLAQVVAWLVLVHSMLAL